MSSEGWERADAALIASVHETADEIERILKKRGLSSPFWDVQEVRIDTSVAASDPSEHNILHVIVLPLTSKVIPSFRDFHAVLERKVQPHMLDDDRTAAQRHQRLHSRMQSFLYQQKTGSSLYKPPSAVAVAFDKGLSPEVDTFLSTLHVSLSDPLRLRKTNADADPEIFFESPDDELTRSIANDTEKMLLTSSSERARWSASQWPDEDSGTFSTADDESGDNVISSVSEELSMPSDRAPCCT
jgi:hypothetical protein